MNTAIFVPTTGPIRLVTIPDSCNKLIKTCKTEDRDIKGTCNRMLFSSRHSGKTKFCYMTSNMYQSSESDEHNNITLTIDDFNNKYTQFCDNNIYIGDTLIYMADMTGDTYCMNLDIKIFDADYITKLLISLFGHVEDFTPETGVKVEIAKLLKELRIEYSNIDHCNF